MADSTIDSEYLILIDRWPGVAIHCPRHHPLPVGGFAGATHHNVETAAYPVGFKLCVYNHSASAGVDGFATFIYLQIEQTGSPTSAAKQVCTVHTAGNWSLVDNDSDDVLQVTGSGLVAVLLSLMTDAYYGWFWCGGVCPEEYVSGLGGTYETDNTVAIGPIEADDLAETDAIGFAAMESGSICIGMSLAADP